MVLPPAELTVIDCDELLDVLVLVTVGVEYIYVAPDAADQLTVNVVVLVDA